MVKQLNNYNKKYVTLQHIWYSVQKTYSQGFAMTNSRMALAILATHSQIVIRDTVCELLINYNLLHSYIRKVLLVYTSISWETLYIRIAIYTHVANCHESRHTHFYRYVLMFITINESCKCRVTCHRGVHD